MQKINLGNTSLNRIIEFSKKHMLAVLGKRSIYILEYSQSFKVIRHFLDEDPNENFLCGVFYLEDKKVKLAVSGESGIIKLLDITEYEIKGYLKGHGGIVTDLKVHPQMSDIIFSSSEDTTIRMWDVREQRCLAIFGGYIGHRDYVLSIDISLCGKRIVSAGTDCVIKVWNIPEKKEALQIIYFPTYSSSKIQKSYITCVKFFGLLIISKSLSNRISIICPETKTTIYKSTINSDSFFISDFRHKNKFKDKFDLKGNRMAIATTEKEVLLFKLNPLEETLDGKKKVFEHDIKDVILTNENVFILESDSSVTQL